MRLSRRDGSATHDGPAITGSPPTDGSRAAKSLYKTYVIGLSLVKQRRRDKLGDVKRTSVSHMGCSVARAVEIVGEWWTLLIVRDVLLGVCRFEDLLRDLGISRNVLTDRLRGLVEHGILARHRYSEAPERYEYRLTEKGEQLFPVIVALLRWGDVWEPATDNGPPITLLHTVCGHDTAARLTCSHCGQPFGPADVRAVPGPGLSSHSSSTWLQEQADHPKS